MTIKFDFSALQNTRWYEYAIRFAFGGVITAVAGLIAKHYGPAFGGLFLAFPAIFPAGATLIEKHETERKLKAGIPQTIRGRQAAALDARGAALGSVGLASFAYMVWKFLPSENAPMALLAAAVAWFVMSVLIWRLQKVRPRRLNPKTK